MPYPGLRRNANYFLICFCLLASSLYLSAQAPTSAKVVAISSPVDDAEPAADFAQYPFLNTTANTLINADHLKTFFAKLRQLENGEIQQINIVHIGDSHIQADWWTGYLRLRLQQRFGSAGRGLVFPYQLANTNSPTDIRSGSNRTWEYRRSTFQQKHIPVGIAGLSVQTKASQVWLDLQIRHDSLLNYAFDKVTLFSQSGPDCLNWSVGGFTQTKAVKMAAPPKKYHRVKSGDTLYGLARRYGTRVSRLQAWNKIRGSMIKPGQKLIVGNGNQVSSNYDDLPFEVWDTANWDQDQKETNAATLYLDSLSHRVVLRANKKNGASGLARIYGLSLEDSQAKGLLYHAIGVNGVTYYHYNQAAEFWTQLPLLKPDLIIVSLGTNESAVTNFKSENFSKETSRFVNNIKQQLGDAQVILTTPSDALRRNRYENPSIQKAREVIIATAANNAFAIWDLYDLMGGHGAIKQWKSHQLAARDHLHFTKAGYSLQGELLFSALMQAYEQH